MNIGVKIRGCTAWPCIFIYYGSWEKVESSMRAVKFLKKIWGAAFELKQFLSGIGIG
jgi:hypothetical protein